MDAAAGFLSYQSEIQETALQVEKSTLRYLKSSPSPGPCSKPEVTVMQQNVENAIIKADNPQSQPRQASAQPKGGVASDPYCLTNPLVNVTTLQEPQPHTSAALKQIPEPGPSASSVASASDLERVCQPVSTMKQPVACLYGDAAPGQVPLSRISPASGECMAVNHSGLSSPIPLANPINGGPIQMPFSKTISYGRHDSLAAIAEQWISKLPTSRMPQWSAGSIQVSNSLSSSPSAGSSSTNQAEGIAASKRRIGSTTNAQPARAATLGAYPPTAATVFRSPAFGVTPAQSSSIQPSISLPDQRMSSLSPLLTTPSCMSPTSVQATPVQNHAKRSAAELSSTSFGGLFPVPDTLPGSKYSPADHSGSSQKRSRIASEPLLNLVNPDKEGLVNAAEEMEPRNISDG